MKLSRRNFLKLFGLSPLVKLPKLAVQPNNLVNNPSTVSTDNFVQLDRKATRRKIELEIDGTRGGIPLESEIFIPDEVLTIGISYQEIEVRQPPEFARGFVLDENNMESFVAYLRDGLKYSLRGHGGGWSTGTNGIPRFTIHTISGREISN